MQFLKVPLTSNATSLPMVKPNLAFCYSMLLMTSTWLLEVEKPENLEARSLKLSGQGKLRGSWRKGETSPFTQYKIFSFLLGKEPTIICITNFI